MSKTPKVYIEIMIEGVFCLNLSENNVLKQPFFAKFWVSRILSSTSFQMLSVTIGWQMYELTNDAFSLGLVGLAQFIPMLCLTLFVGQIADRYDRRRIVFFSLIIESLTAAFLLIGSIGGWMDRELILLSAALIGACRAFEGPTANSLLPQIVSRNILPRAISMSTTAIQTALIIGPTVGGLLLAFGAPAVYVSATIALMLSALLMYFIKVEQVKDRKLAAVSFRSFFLGLEFIFKKKVIFGSISMDLFVVLLGGATALLPIFAQDILQTGPWGLGLLRAAPAVGAILVSAVLSYYPLNKSVGKTLFAAIAVYGLATILFAISTNLYLSLFALMVIGGSDVISMVIRSSLVQLQTPDELRGRVNAVNSLFTSSSFQLGEFRAGSFASFMGAGAAVFVGGIGSIVVAGLWMYMFPSIRKLESLSKS